MDEETRVAIEKQEADGWLRGADPRTLPDERYLELMARAGRRVRQWSDRYLGLLIGAYQRGLPSRNGFRDVYHMAALQARCSRDKVRRVLKIGERLAATPQLFGLFERGTASWTKIRSVANLIAPERDAWLCEIVMTRSRRELDLLVQASRSQDGRGTGRRAGVHRPPPVILAAPLAGGGPVLRKLDPDQPRPPSGVARDPDQPRPPSGVARDPDQPTPPSGVARDPDATLAETDRGRPRVDSAPPGESTGHPRPTPDGYRPGSDLTVGPESSPPGMRPALHEGPGSSSSQDGPAGPRDAAPHCTERSDRGIGTGQAHGGGTTGVDGSPSAAPDLESDSGRNPRPEPIPGVPGNVLVIDPIAMQRLVRHQDLLSRREGRPLSLAEALERVILLFSVEGHTTVPHLEVVVRDPATDRAFIPTCAGPMPLDADDLAYRSRSGPPIELERELQSRRETELAEAHAGAPELHPASGYVPARIRRLAFARDRGLCAFRDCARLPALFHHRNRRSISRSHLVDDLICLCDDHHTLVHAGLIENEYAPPAQWRVRLDRPDPALVDRRVDAVDAAFRRKRDNAPIGNG